MSSASAHALLDQLRQLDESDRIEVKQVSAIGESLLETFCFPPNSRVWGADRRRGGVLPGIIENGTIREIERKAREVGDSMNAHSDLIGVGLYTLPEASALTGIRSAAISRWAFGYVSRYDDDVVRHPPVWTPQLAGYERKALGFLDLLEVRFVAAFKQHGVSLQAIRAASRFARECFHSSHPFACKSFKTDGKSIFAEVLKEEGLEDRALIDLVKRQYAFREVVSPSLYRGIQYGEQGHPLSWRPGNSRYVILDPNRAFGRPIDHESGVPTEVLYQSFLAEGDLATVARIYEVKPRAVTEAIAFEKGLGRDAALH